MTHITTDDSCNTSKIFEHAHVPHPRRHSTLDVHAEIFVPRSINFISAINLKCRVRSSSSEGNVCFLNPCAKSFERFSSINEPILFSAKDYANGCPNNLGNNIEIFYKTSMSDTFSAARDLSFLESSLPLSETSSDTSAFSEKK